MDVQDIKEHVTKFIAVAKRHCLSLKKEVTIYPYKSCKNLYAHGDDTVKSHLVRYGFIKDSTIWKFYGEAEDPSVGASGGGGNSSTATTAAVNVEQQTSLAAAGGHDNAGTGDNAECDNVGTGDTANDNHGRPPVRVSPKDHDLPYLTISNLYCVNDAGRASWATGFAL
jgi:hypothetical protein